MNTNILQTKNDAKWRCFLLMSGVLTSFFALVMVFGESFAANNNWEAVFAYPIFSFISFLCYFSLFFVLSRLAGKMLFNRVQAEPGRYPRHTFFLIWGALFLMWLPYIICFYPGIANSDVPDQLAMAFNFENGSYLLIDKPLTEEVLINGHHPVFNTWIHGLFLRMGIVLGSQNIGIFLHVLWVASFTTGVFSYSIYYMMCRFVPFKLCLALILIFGLIPCFPLYGINIVKNSTYSAWVYLSVILLLRLATEGEALCKNRRFLLLFSLTLLMQMLNIKHGIHVVILTAIPLCFAYRRSIGKILPSILVPVLLYRVVFTGIMMPALQISPGSDREIYGFLYQQTARYVRDYPNEVTPEEREAIDGVLEYDKLARLYNPITSDPVKFEAYRSEQTLTDRSAYLKTWARQFIKHPGVYVEAIINGCYGFFYPGLREWYDYLDFSNVIQERGNGFFQIYHPASLEQFRGVLTRIEYNAKYLPVIGLFFRHGVYTWLLLWCSMILLAAGRYRYLTALMPFLCNILVCVASPYNANTRYLLPVIYGAGLSLLTTFAAIQKDG